MNHKKIIITCICLALTVSAVFAQSSTKGMNAAGMTGVVITPTAMVSWDDADMGLDFSYSMITKDEMAHIPAVTFSFMERGEVAFAYDMEDTEGNDAYNNALIGVKFQLYKEKGTALAIGGDFEIPNGERFENVDDEDKNSADVYIVTTYSGDFFELPAVTTMLFGWQVMAAGDDTTSFNYSMGFEMGLFPDQLEEYVFWIVDFSNYSYAIFNDRISTHRGIFNTGLRITPLNDDQYKLTINLIGTDLMDENSRGFMAGTSFGFSF